MYVCISYMKMYLSVSVVLRLKERSLQVRETLSPHRDREKEESEENNGVYVKRVGCSFDGMKWASSRESK